MTRITLALLAAGAVLGACTTVEEAFAQEYRATLTGAAEVPGPGDPDGRGTAEVEIRSERSQLCYDVEVTGIDTPTTAHIHRGAVGAGGPPVVTLVAPADGDSDGCLEVAAELAAEIVANPAGFYVNVHNAAFPAGAVRGQLGR